MSKKKIIQTAGKRKTAIARATMRPGKGMIRINKVLLDNMKPQLVMQRIKEPLMLLDDNLVSSIDVDIDVRGGGINGQADAARIALCRALCEHAGAGVRETLVSYDRNLLVADTRFKEKSKPGRHGQARAKRQKSYR